MKKNILLALFPFYFVAVNAQWTQIYHTPFQQEVHVLSSPSDSICWFISNMDSLFKTVDAGNTWTKTIQTNAIFNPSGLFVVDENIAFKSANTSMYKTSNGGVSWRLVFSGASSQPPVVWMKNSLTGVLAYNGQIFLSTDSGETWNTTGIAQPPLAPINSNGKGNIQVLGDTIFLACHNSGVIYSPDYGNTWVQPANAGLSISSPARISFSDTQFGLAIYGSFPFVYLTTNGAASWTSVDNSLGSNEDVLSIGREAWYIPNPADHFYIKYSADSGAHWTPQLTDPDGFDVLEHSRNGTTLWAGSDKGKIYTNQQLLSTGIHSSAVAKGEILISPNPSTGDFLIQIKNEYRTGEISVFNLNGEKIFSQPLSEKQVRFGKFLERGSYILEITKEKLCVFRQVILKQ